MAAAKRTVKRPGPTEGKQFYSCGKYSALKGRGECNFFEWIEDGHGGEGKPLQEKVKSEIST